MSRNSPNDHEKSDQTGLLSKRTRFDADFSCVLPIKFWLLEELSLKMNVGSQQTFFGKQTCHFLNRT